MDALPVAVYATDTEGRLTYFNAAAAKLSGRTPQIGTDQWCVTWKLFRADGTPLEHDACPMAKVLKGESVSEGGEYVAERPDGTRFWFTPYPALLRDAEGRVIGGLNLLVEITERKMALQESEERFRAIVETTPECVKVIARDGTVLHMNSAGLDMVGAESAKDVVNKNVYDLIAPEDRERYRHFNENICDGKKESLAFDIVGLRGSRHHMETYAAPFKRPNGATAQIAVTRDVGERRRMERAALLLSAIVDSSDDAIISKDLTGIITSWNKGAERLFGYTADETIGRSVLIIIPPDRFHEEPKILDQLRRGQKVDHFETIRRRKDGTLVDISLTISPIRDAHGKIIGASKIARDITSRKRVEAALKESETRFRQLADSMPQMVWTARPDGQVDYYNERWYRFIGLGRPTLEGGSWEPLLHPDDLESCRNAWRECIRNGEPFAVESRFWDRAEDRWRWFMGRAIPVRETLSDIEKWFGTWTDIDIQKRVEEEFRCVNRDLEQFAFSASHDLQEPIRNISIYSQLLELRYRNQFDGEALEFLRYMREGAKRMETLVRDLLSYTQIGKLEATCEETDANKALSMALADLGQAVSGANITSESLPTVSIHAAHLQQLFQNLIGNALKYHKPNTPPVIHVAAEQQNKQWIFSIRDNGIGIAPEYQEKIFGLFKRLHTKDEYSGTGIGLAICQRIIDRYHGRIWVDSVVGDGSTFRFALPL